MTESPRPMITVCLTFDVDAEAGLAAELDAHRERLSTVSEREFSVRRGLPISARPRTAPSVASVTMNGCGTRPPT
jgi:hypothetical protein